MLEKLEKTIYSIKVQEKVAFCSAIIVGLFAHYFVIVNKLTNHDDIRETCSDMTQLVWGRWFLGVASNISGRMSMPFNCLLALVFVALAAGFVVATLDIESVILSGIVGALMSTAPSMTFSFLYNSSADPYGLAILFMALGSYIAIKCKNRILNVVVPTILFTLSLGIYQAYMGLAFGILILSGLLRLSYEKLGFRLVLLEELRYLLTGVVSLVLYLAISKALNLITGTQMSEYQGMDKMGSINLATLPYQVRLSFVKPIGFFLTNDRGVHYVWLKYALGVLFVFTAVVFILSILKAKLGKYEVALIAILLVCLPVSAGFAYIEGAANVHLLLTYSYLVILLFVILVIDKTDGVKTHIRIFQGCGLLTFSLLIFNYVTLSNKVYVVDYYTYENSYSYAQTISSVIRTTPGYNEDSVIYFIGIPSSKSIAVDEFYQDDKRVEAFDQTGLDRDFNEEYSRNSFYWYYLGLTNSIRYIDINDAKGMGIEDLRVFPYENSVHTVGGDIVIRFE